MAQPRSSTSSTPLGEEKDEAKRKLVELQIAINQQALDYESTLVKSRADTIRAEAQSGSWIAANWRPITMLSFTTLIILHWLGVGATASLPPAEVEGLLEIVKIGLGGYVVGRSAEKVMRAYKQP